MSCHDLKDNRISLTNFVFALFALVVQHEFKISQFV